MSDKVRWGVLSTAKIGTEKVLPAMLKAKNVVLQGIASRNAEKAHLAAETFRFNQSYGSYEELLADDSIDAVYIPLPNHMHLEWTLKAMEAGKHVLCEKPLTLSVKDAETLMAAVEKSSLKVGEAFMIASHPQWKRAKVLTQGPSFGAMKAITGYFSYYNVDEKNIRNVPEFGGGGIYDIGCYPTMASRLILGEEPVKAFASVVFDGKFKTDILAHVMLQFPTCTSTFTVSTQMSPTQRMMYIGEKQSLEIDIPFNAPLGGSTDITLADNFTPKTPETISACDMYTLEAEEFSRAILEDTEVPVPASNAYAMGKIYEAIFKSAKSGRWESV